MTVRGPKRPVVGSFVRVPDRTTNAWGRVIAIEGSLVRVSLGGSWTTTSQVVWYRLADVFTDAEWRARWKERGQATEEA
jgi:hypothetical protein